MPSYKILVIDDSKVIRKRITEMLRDVVPPQECEIMEAQDGVEGLQLLGVTFPNLIILDFFLPKLNGFQVYEEIQKQPRFKKIPLVIMSGRKEEVVEKLPQAFDYCAFIEKPFDKEQLIAGIRDAMGKSKKLAQIPEVSPISEEADQTIADKDAEIEQLKLQMDKMQSEVDLLKDKLSQVIRFLKQKFQ